MLGNVLHQLGQARAELPVALLGRQHEELVLALLLVDELHLDEAAHQALQLERVFGGGVDVGHLEREELRRRQRLDERA